MQISDLDASRSLRVSTSNTYNKLTINSVIMAQRLIPICALLGGFDISFGSRQHTIPQEGKGRRILSDVEE